jgi:hypothetical protein
VEHAFVFNKVDVDARFNQLGGISVALVAERIESGGDNNRGRCASKIGEDRRVARVAEVFHRDGVVIVEPIHGVTSEHVALSVFCH